MSHRFHQTVQRGQNCCCSLCDAYPVDTVHIEELGSTLSICVDCLRHLGHALGLGFPVLPAKTWQPKQGCCAFCGGGFEEVNGRCPDCGAMSAVEVHE